MSNWHQSYARLQEYISQHPEIEITINGSCIPGEVREEFFRLFDVVRSDFVREAFPAQLKEAEVAGRAFLAAEKEAISCLKLKEVKIEQNLRWFLQDPVDGLRRRLFDPLFDLLRGALDAEGFEKTSTRIAEDLIQRYAHRSYAHWATLSLIPLLSPDSAHVVPIKDETIDPYLTTEGRQGRFTETIPDLATPEWLFLDASQYVPLLVPKIICHSAMLDTFVALRNGFHSVDYHAYELFKTIKTKQWHDLEDLRRRYGPHHLWPDIGLYLDSNPDELRIVADYQHALWPEIIVDVMEAPDWYESGGLEIVRLHYEVLRPRLGSFVVYREALPETAIPQGSQAQATETGDEMAPAPEEDTTTRLLRELPESIHLLSVGYDSTRLGPIIEALAKSRPGPKQSAG